MHAVSPEDTGLFCSPVGVEKACAVEEFDGSYDLDLG